MAMTATSAGRLGAVLTLVAMVGLAGCEVNKTTGEQTLTGAGVGAASGAAVGLLTGNFLGSAVTGPRPAPPVASSTTRSRRASRPRHHETAHVDPPFVGPLALATGLIPIEAELVARR